MTNEQTCDGCGKATDTQPDRKGGGLARIGHLPDHGAIKCRPDLAITARFTMQPLLDAWRDGVILCKECYR